MMTSPSSSAQSRGLSADTGRYVDEWLGYQLWRHRLPGLQAAVAVGGVLVHSVALGVADADRGIALTPDHRMRFASHAKMVTATIASQLAEEGLLGLDDPVHRYLPDDVPPGTPLAGATLRELLSHTSGAIRDGADADFWQLLAPFPDRRGLLATVVEDGAVREPGVGFGYSNVGYGLVGLVLEAATGTGYAELVRRRVVEPFGLPCTTADLDPAAPLATGHSGLLVTDRRTTMAHSPAGAFAPAAGLTSTAEDVCRFLAAQSGGAGRAALPGAGASLHRQHWPSPRYGLGFALDGDGSRSVVGHSGGYPGFASQSLVDLERGLAVSVAANATDAPATAIARGLLGLLAHATADAAREERCDAAGRYAGTSALVDLTTLDGLLVALDPRAEDPASDAQVLRRVDVDTYLAEPGTGLRGDGERVCVIRDEDGRPTSLRARGGRTLRLVRSFVPGVTPTPEEPQ